MLNINNFIDRHQKFVKAVEILTLFAVIYVAIYLSITDSRIQGYIDLIKQQGVWGQIIFILYWSSTIVITPLPATPLKPVAILAWGFWPSYLLILVADMIGGTFSFLIARKFGRSTVKKFLGKSKFKSINKMINTHNFKSIFELRFITNFAYDYVSYACGLTDMKFGKYFTSSLLSKVIWAYILLYVVERAIHIKDNPLGIIPIIIYVIGTIWLGMKWEKRIKEN